MTERDSEHITPMVLPDNALDRLNYTLDSITLLPYLSPTIFVQGVRMALHKWGLLLPLQDIEGTTVPTIVPARDMDDNDDGDEDDGIDHPRINDGYHAPPDEMEEAFAVDDSGLYLYMVVDRTEKGLYDCYAQMVTLDELAEIWGTDDGGEEEDKDIVGGDTGETAYAQLQRHAGTDISQ